MADTPTHAIGHRPCNSCRWWVCIPANTIRENLVPVCMHKNDLNFIMEHELESRIE